MGVTLYLLSITDEYLALIYVPVFSYYTNTFHLIPADDLPLVTMLYGAVVVGYSIHIAQFVYYSLQYRQLIFPQPSAPYKELGSHYHRHHQFQPQIPRASTDDDSRSSAWRHAPRRS